MKTAAFREAPHAECHPNAERNAHNESENRAVQNKEGQECRDERQSAATELARQQAGADHGGHHAARPRNEQKALLADTHQRRARNEAGADQRQHGGNENGAVRQAAGCSSADSRAVEFDDK